MKTCVHLLRIVLGLITPALGLEVAPPRCRAQSIPILIVPTSKETLHVAIDLPEKPARGTGWKLIEEEGGKRTVLTQTVDKIAADGTKDQACGRLVADIAPSDCDVKIRRFRLELLRGGSPPNASFAVSATGPQTVCMSEGNKPVLAYNYGTITDERISKTDNRRSRACYIHPLWGLGGEVLTDDFPKDHYHHHGVFWAWPHVEIGDEKYDLWMYKTITPKFVRWLSCDVGPLAAVLGVENGWFVDDRRVMIERVWIRVNKATRTERAVDLDFTWIPIDRPITLRGAEGKSYGGLTLRFAVANEKDSTITVPAGTSQKDLPDTSLPWADLSAKFAGAKQPSGAAIFAPREHPDYPPTWLTRHYGALCVGWPGVKGKTFEPGKPIHLQYRIWIHAGAAGMANLQAAYNAYQATAKVQWE